MTDESEKEEKKTKETSSPTRIVDSIKTPAVDEKPSSSASGRRTSMIPGQRMADRARSRSNRSRKSGASAGSGANTPKSPQRKASGSWNPGSHMDERIAARRKRDAIKMK